MIIALIILVYILSTILAWVMLRNWNKKHHQDAQSVEIMLCLMPVVNIVTILVLLSENIEINANKFFRL